LASKELFDYLSAATVNFTSSALQLSPQEVIEEMVTKNQMVRYGDDGSEERISFSNSPIAYVNLRWPTEMAANIGTIFDYWMSTGKGNGIARSFKLNYGDGHTYCARFADDVTRTMRPGPYALGIQGVPQMKLKILGTT